MYSAKVIPVDAVLVVTTLAMLVSVTVTLHVSLRGTLQVATPFLAVILTGWDIDCVTQETTMSLWWNTVNSVVIVLFSLLQ